MQPPSGGCVLKPIGVWFDIISLLAATFGWLCVETKLLVCNFNDTAAATFGWLCVETKSNSRGLRRSDAATFGWLCVETCVAMADATSLKQPPSGGCVLKPVVFALHPSHNRAATFGWLCVETARAVRLPVTIWLAATFGWLCVETLIKKVG